MITAEKIVIFKSYKGYYDGYYMQNRDGNRIVSDEEWSLLNNFMQEIFLIRKKLTSKSFELKIITSIYENCDNIETFLLIFNAENEINS